MTVLRMTPVVNLNLEPEPLMVSAGDIQRSRNLNPRSKSLDLSLLCVNTVNKGCPSPGDRGE